MVAQLHQTILHRIKVKSRWRQLTLAIFLVGITLFLYFPSLKYHFFQDDFYTLVKSQASSFNDWLKFFLPGQEVYYRPLSMRVYFWVIHALFGPNAQVFHLSSLAIHLLNSFLVWKFVGRLLKKSFLAWVSALLYATSSLHFISIYWISEVGLLLGITFYLATCNQFLTYLKTKKSLDKIKILTLFLLGLLSHEFMVTIPVILTVLWLMHKRSILPGTKHAWTTLWPFWIGDALYLILRLLILPFQASGTYTLSISKATLQALFWYGIWSLNILENIKDQLEPGVKLNQTFLYQYPGLSLLYLSTLILVVVFLIAIPVILFIQATETTKKFLIQVAGFAAIWVAATLILPLLIPLHLYPMYASLSLVGVTIFITTAIWELYSRPRLIITILMTVWLLLSWQTLRLTEKIHWTVQEAKRVQETLSKINQLYPHLPKGSTIVIDQDYQIEQALSGDLGLKFLLRNPTLNTLYGSPESIAPQSCTMEKDAGDCLIRHNIFVLTN